MATTQPDSKQDAEPVTDTTAAILASRTVAVADDLHTTALEAESNPSAAAFDDLAEALDDARTELKALDGLANEARQ